MPQTKHHKNKNSLQSTSPSTKSQSFKQRNNKDSDSSFDSQIKQNQNPPNEIFPNQQHISLSFVQVVSEKTSSDDFIFKLSDDSILKSSYNSTFYLTQTENTPIQQEKIKNDFQNQENAEEIQESKINNVFHLITSQCKKIGIMEDKSDVDQIYNIIPQTNINQLQMFDTQEDIVIDEDEDIVIGIMPNFSPFNHNRKHRFSTDYNSNTIKSGNLNEKIPNKQFFENVIKFFKEIIGSNN